jgi:glycosyltransferase involved in cell wall biosynthesis
LSFKVSVIIPVYNCEKYISRSIQSVLAIEEVTELIIVDDGSTDLTFNICKDFKKIDSRIKIFFHEGRKNRGVSASRNLGIKNAKNNFIAFLDADDYYLPNRFKVTSECFAFDQSIEGVYEAIGVHNSSENVFQWLNSD